MKNAALILVALAAAFALGLMPVGDPLVETDHGVRILDYRVTIRLHVGIEHASLAAAASIATLVADSLEGGVQ